MTGRHYVVRDYGWYAEDSDGVIYLGNALANLRLYHAGEQFDVSLACQGGDCNHCPDSIECLCACHVGDDDPDDHSGGPDDN